MHAVHLLEHLLGDVIGTQPGPMDEERYSVVDPREIPVSDAGCDFEDSSDIYRGGGICCLDRARKIDGRRGYLQRKR
jgi:hypothetical protein